MRIAAVVILYHPPENVVDNIMTYYNHVEKLYVFDNTENDVLKEIKDKFTSLSKIEFYHDKKNEGIAKRLNQAARMAIQEGFDWLLTMDQDTSFSKDAIETYVKCFSEYQAKDTVSMFGTDYGNNKGVTTAECVSEETDILITSGVLLNLQLFLKIGDFDEKLFIDSVDHDYGIRSRLSGFHLIKFKNVYTQHALGKEVYRSSIKSLFLVKKKKIIHSPSRCYYMYRNLLYLQKKFEGCNLPLVKKIRKIVIGNLKANIFYGRQSLSTLKFLVTGFRDYRRMKMGKLRKEL